MTSHKSHSSSNAYKLIYPESTKFNHGLHNKNISKIKQLQVENRNRKEEKENNKLTPNQVKNKEYQHVKAKVMTNSLNKHKISVKNILSKDYKSNEETIDKICFDKNFEDYEENIYSLNNKVKSDQKYNDDIKIMTKNDYVLGHNVHMNQNSKNSNNAFNINNNKIENNKENQLKVELDKRSLTKPKVNQKEKQIDDKIHNNYGKVPDYINKFKKEAEEKKENEKKLAEESKYPKGTRLLSEEERLQTLDSLIKTKKELENVLFKLPITMKTLAIQSKKTELENKLCEIENSIDKFSRKKVYIKSEE